MLVRGFLFPDSVCLGAPREQLGVGRGVFFAQRGSDELMLAEVVQRAPTCVRVSLSRCTADERRLESAPLRTRSLGAERAPLSSSMMGVSAEVSGARSVAPCTSAPSMAARCNTTNSTSARLRYSGAEKSPVAPAGCVRALLRSRGEKKQTMIVQRGFRGGNMRSQRFERRRRRRRRTREIRALGAWVSDGPLSRGSARTALARRFSSRRRRNASSPRRNSRRSMRRSRK